MTPTDFDELVASISRRYERELLHSGNPLGTVGESPAARQHRVGRIVADVIGCSHGRFTDAPTITDELVLEASANGVTSTDAVNALEALFRIALPELTSVAGRDPVEVAAALMRRLMLEVTDAFEALADRQLEEIPIQEFIDMDALRRLVSKRQAAVFQHIVENYPTAKIAHELGITPHTVKNHITALGGRLGVQGRTALMQRARELSILVAVPAAMLATTISDAVTTANMM